MTMDYVEELGEKMFTLKPSSLNICYTIGL